MPLPRPYEARHKLPRSVFMSAPMGVASFVSRSRVDIGTSFRARLERSFWRSFLMLLAAARRSFLARFVLPDARMFSAPPFLSRAALPVSSSLLRGSHQEQTRYVLAV